MRVRPPAWGKFRNSLAQLAEGLLALVYPPRCLICLKCEQNASCRCLCEVCLNRVLTAAIPHVRPWQNPAETHTGLHTCACDLAAWFYEDGMLALVPHMKYQNRPSLAKFFARLAAERLRGAVDVFLSPRKQNPAVASVLVPVPLHPRRQRERGYNQSLLIARVLSAKWNIALEPGLLRRTRFTQPQAQLNAAERAQNVNGAFAPMRADRIAGRTVLVIDDVITTGATVSACARALLQAGAVRVIAVALARTGKEFYVKHE
ncbi:MAG: ComF family protein [bacterium]